MLKADLNCFNYFRSSNKAVFSGSFSQLGCRKGSSRWRRSHLPRVENGFCGGLICQDMVQPTRWLLVFRLCFGYLNFTFHVIFVWIIGWSNCVRQRCDDSRKLWFSWSPHFSLPDKVTLQLHGSLVFFGIGLNGFHYLQVCNICTIHSPWMGGMSRLFNRDKYCCAISLCLCFYTFSIHLWIGHLDAKLGCFQLSPFFLTIEVLSIWPESCDILWTLSKYWHSVFSLSFSTPTKPIAQYCIACNVSTLDCSHNRVGSLASMGRMRSWKKGFAQVPLTMFKVRNSTVCDVYDYV